MVSFPRVSLHNHTSWSDGLASVREMIAEAGRIGLEEVGISDHYTLYPGGAAISWSMPLDRLAQYVHEVQESSADSGPAVRIGVEADYFPETVEALRIRLDALPFDYVIGSVHFVGDFALDSDAADWAPLSPEEVNETWRGYWRLIRSMAETRVFDIAAHLDLPKKFGFRPHADLTSLETDALEAIANSGMAIEINTNGWNMPAAEAYPSLRLLRQARALGIPLLISSDAHWPDRLADRFEDARRLARDAGYSRLSRFHARRRSEYPL